MPKILISEGFKCDLLKIETDRMFEAVLGALDLLETIPAAGSRNVPVSIRHRHGNAVRKLVVGPFDVIYRYDEEADVVYVAGLLHQREAW